MAAKAAQRARISIEKIVYTPQGLRFRKEYSSSQTVTPINIIHRDVFTAEFVSFFKEHNPGEVESLIKSADEAASLIFDLLGSGPVDLKAFRARKDLRYYPSGPGAVLKPADAAGQIPWHFDFKSGVGWHPQTFFSDIRYGEVLGVDVKVPWELSRCQHFITLGQAYRLTGDEKYARAFFDQIEDWIRNNPVKFGVNWACPMDVGLRACNWLAAWDFFKTSASITSFFKENFARSLSEHGSHIFAHLEWSAEVSANHYLSNLIGLAYLGIALRNRRWLEFSFKQLQKEILSQTYDDGFDFEGSTAYHRLVLEIFTFFTLVYLRSLGAKNGSSSLDDILSSFHISYLDRFKKMFDVLLQLCSEQGRIPLIGDNDSGRVHVFSRHQETEVRYLCQIGALLLQKSYLKIKEWPMTPEVLWLFGLKGKERFEGLEGISAEEIPSKQEGGSGLRTLRTPSECLIFCAQPNGTRGIGNHTHNDKLSFTLTVLGEEFFIDPGTFVYTVDPQMRNAFRSTAMHNTVMIDGEEQNRFTSESLFLLQNDAQLDIAKDKGPSVIEASHSGYVRLRFPVIHSRRVERGANEWAIKDEFKGEGEHELVWRFVLGEEIQIERLEPSSALLKGKGSQLELRFTTPIASLKEEAGFFSPAYGVQRPTKTLRATHKGQLPLTFCFLLKAHHQRSKSPAGIVG